MDPVVVYCAFCKKIQYEIILLNNNFLQGLKRIRKNKNKVWKIEFSRFSHNLSQLPVEILKKKKEDEYQNKI